MSEAIRMDRLGKRYWKLDQPAVLLRSLIPFARPRRSELWALRDVDLSINKGETVGVIGRNGSGKTTMLRLLCGVTRPTEGRLVVRGRIAPLISIGVGFRPEMSGRENLLVSGMLLGLTRAEVQERSDEIVAFAELEDFIDTPVKSYSSGMFLRLGMALAIHTDPEVLLVDEVLAVGDLAFQSKCHKKMQSIRDSGATIVVVSHSMAPIRRVCSRVIVLRRGRLEFDGEPEAAIDRYHQLLAVDSPSPFEIQEARSGHRIVTGGATILDHCLVGPNGSTHHVDHSTPVELKIKVRFERETESPIFGMYVFAEDGALVYGRQSAIGLRYRNFFAGEVTEATMGFIPRLSGGTYRIQSAVGANDGGVHLAEKHDGLLFYVDSRPGVYGMADLEAAISVEGIDLMAE